MSNQEKPPIKKSGEDLIDLPFEKMLHHPKAPWRQGSYEHFDGDFYPEVEETPVYQKIKEKFPKEVFAFRGFRGDPVAFIRKNQIQKILEFLRDDPSCLMTLLRDLFVVDNLKTKERVEEIEKIGLGEDTRFEVIYSLYSLRFRHSIRLRVPLTEKDAKIDTVFQIYKGANWFEREAWDMFGVVFSGHPELTRILNHDAFEGHPLRKDYPINRRHNLINPKEI